MSLSVAGTYQNDVGLPLAYHDFTIGSIVYVAEGVYVPGGFITTTRFAVKRVFVTTDASGNYGATLDGDVIAFAVLPAHCPGSAFDGTAYVPTLFWQTSIQTGPISNPQSLYVFGSQNLPHCADGMGNVGFGQPSALHLYSSYDAPYDFIGSIYSVSGIAAEVVSPLDGLHFLTGGRTVNILATGWRQKVQFRQACKAENPGGVPKYYVADGMQVRFDFFGGGSETVTTDSEGISDVTVADINTLCGLTILSGAPTCANLNTHPAWVDPHSVHPTWVSRSAWFQGKDFNFCGGSPVDVTLIRCQTTVLVADIPPCICSGATTPANEAVRADTHSGQIAVAWTDGGKLYTSVHRGPQKQIGDGGTDWETPEQIESANASDCGVAYLPNGVLYLCYDLSSAKKYRTNKAFGSSGFWSSAGTPSPSASRQSAVGRGQGQAFRFRALGAVGASGSVEFSQCRDNRGAAWTTAVTAVTGARGPFCGGVWLGNGYGLLYTEHSTGKVRWLKAIDPGNWPAGPGADTGMSGQVVGLTLTSAGVLIGLLWDWDGTVGNKRFRACRSRDRGATWEKDTSDIGALPALDTPPAVVSLEQMAYAVYVVNNTPQFAASIDSGVSWI